MRVLHEAVVAGLGAIAPGGDFTPGTAAPAVTRDQHGLEGFQLEAYLSSHKTYLDRCSALALAGCALALRNAGVAWPVAEHGFDAHDFGLTLGTHLGCIETMHHFWEKAVEKGMRLANPLLFSHSYFNSPISLCAIEFGLKGFHGTFCHAEESGIAAVRAACDAIRLGHATAMLCGGVEALTPARRLYEADPRAGEASAWFVLMSRDAANLPDGQPLTAIDDSTLDAAAGLHHEVRLRYGDCGGAHSALALALLLTREDLGQDEQD